MKWEIPSFGERPLIRLCHEPRVTEDDVGRVEKSPSDSYGLGFADSVQPLAGISKYRDRARANSIHRPTENGGEDQLLRVIAESGQMACFGGTYSNGRRIERGHARKACGRIHFRHASDVNHRDAGDEPDQEKRTERDT